MTKIKLLNYILDFLMLVVPVLELTELIAIIPVEYLPYYMLASVLLRRGIRIVEETLGKDNDNLAP
jgi:hypothetical protein